MSKKKSDNIPQWIENAINAACGSSSSVPEEPVKMPWLDLIDNVTGELPKNYKQILAKKEEEQKQKSVCEQRTENVPENVSHKTPEPVRMPWLRLLDPVTGELPKNYKQILAREEEERKQQLAFPKSTEAKNLATGTLSTNFKPFQLFGKELSATKPDVMNKKVSVTLSTKSKKRRSSGAKISKIINIKTAVTKQQPEKCARKKLFNLSPAATKLIKPMKKNKQKCTVKTTNSDDLSNESVSLADMSEVEKQFLHRQSTQESQDGNFESINISPITSEANRSTNEFVQLEVQLQTPKLNVAKPKKSPSPDLRNFCVERFTQIGEQHSKLVEETKEILNELKKSSKRRNHTIENEDNKENITSPITSEANHSTNEFVQLEVQLQTTKLNVTKPKKSPSPDLWDFYIERLTQIVEQQSKLVEETKEILNELKESSKRRNRTTENEDNKENITSPITSETNRSTNEFVQLEVQLQTPKLNVAKPKKSPSPDLWDFCIERFTQIVEQHSKLLEETKEILNVLKKSSKRRNHTTENKDNEENIPTSRKGKSPASILTSSKKKDLRRDILKKTVSFNKNTEKVERALEWYDTMKRSCSVLQTPKFQTPNRMRRHLSDKVQLQCLMLQDTPTHI